MGDRARRVRRAPRRVVRAPQLRVRRDQQPGSARPQAGPYAAAEGRAVERACGAGLGEEAPILKVEDLTVAYATDAGPVVAVDDVDLELGPRRVPRDRRRVGLREVDAALRDRAAARRADGRRDRRRARALPGPRPRAARGEAAPRRPLARSLGRDAERDECAQPGADRRRADARRLRGPLQLVEGGDRSPLARGAAARLHRPGAPAQLPAPALGRDAAARDDRDGAALHARPDHHGRADLGARRRRPALADGADQGAAGGAGIRGRSSSRTTCRS